MKREEFIEEKVGRETPFRVPDNYFESFIAEVEAKLPPYPAAPKPERLSTWHRIRPYVYLAAMFCGIWCMMKIFHSAADLSNTFETPSDQIAMVMENPSAYDIGFATSPQDDFQLEMEVVDAYDSPAELREDLESLGI